jgi:predicted NAD/FAD-binding protein
MRRVAVIGSGIAGLSAAWHLSDPAGAGPRCAVTLYEAADYLGGVNGGQETRVFGGEEAVLI